MGKLSRYWQTWISKRFKIKDSKTLAQRDVLVFFNKEGYLYLLLLIITFIAGVNYGNNLILALCFLLSSILVLSFYLAFRQLYKLHIYYEIPELGQVGQAVELKFTFEPMAGHLHLHLRCEYAQTSKKMTILKQPLTLNFSFIAQKRGQHQLEPLYFYSVYPFGIIRAWSYLYFDRIVWIAPQPLEVNLTSFGLNPRPQDQRKGMEDFSHLREFVTGDSLNRVAWQQLAKGRGLLVKEFEEHEQQHLSFYYQDMPAHLHEDKLSQLMYLVTQAYEQGAGFSLKLPSSELAFGQGEQHFREAKLLLAQEP